jgi:protein-disulfide isomerase
MTSRKLYREENFFETLWSHLPGVIHLLSVVVLVGVLINFTSNFTNSADTNTDNFEFVNNSPLQREYNYTLGKADSNVTYVVFDDFQCPACRQFNSTKKDIFQTYGDRVNLVRKHNPLSEIHANATIAGRSVQAAGNQGKFAEFGDEIFDNQDKLTPTFLESIAKEQGLDFEKWQSDRDSRDIKKQVEQDQKDLSNVYLPKSSISDQTKPVGQGVGTPTNVVIVDNEIYDWWSGGASKEQISKILDDALAGVEREELKNN